MWSPYIFIWVAVPALLSLGNEDDTVKPMNFKKFYQRVDGGTIQCTKVACRNFTIDLDKCFRKCSHLDWCKSLSVKKNESICILSNGTYKFFGKAVSLWRYFEKVITNVASGRNITEGLQIPDFLISEYLKDYTDPDIIRDNILFIDLGVVHELYGLSINVTPGETQETDRDNWQIHVRDELFNGIQGTCNERKSEYHESIDDRECIPRPVKGRYVTLLGIRENVCSVIIYGRVPWTTAVKWQKGSSESLVDFLLEPMKNTPRNYVNTLLLDSWDTITVIEVNLSFMRGNSTVKSLSFDARNANRTAWFTQDRLLWSNFRKIFRKTVKGKPLLFSIERVDCMGNNESSKSFIISTGRCCSDTGWIAIEESGNSCLQGNTDTPTFMSSNNSWEVPFNTSIGPNRIVMADEFIISVRHEEPLLTTQTPLTTQGSSDGDVTAISEDLTTQSPGNGQVDTTGVVDTTKIMSTIDETEKPLLTTQLPLMTQGSYDGDVTAISEDLATQSPANGEVDTTGVIDTTEIMSTIDETDECLMASDGCEHECINTPDSFYCECRTGYEISQDKKTCDDIDECVTNENTCSITADNTVCNNTDGGYTCECVKNTERSEEGKCEIASTDQVDWCKEQTLKVCSPIDTTGTVNHVSPLWPKTNVNCTTEWIACEGNLKGKRRRFCGGDRQWGAIDDTFCMSKNITDVWNEHLNITDIPSNIKTLYDLRMVLLPGTTASSGDLVVGSEIFGRVIDLRYLSKMQGSIEVKERLIEETIQTASTLLDPDNAPLWENYVKFRGPIGGADVVVMHFDRFAAEVGEFMKTYDIKEIKVSSPNIDFQASVVHSSWHSSYAFPSPFPNKTNFFQNASFEMVNHDKESLVFIPAATVSAIADQAANGTTIIISALYRDLTRILSAETVTEEQTREWVTTITARKDVVAVNSDVFSVILQPNRLSETLPEPIIIKYYHKQEAWDPKCSFIQFGNSLSLWSADDCQMSTHNSAEADDYTICECGHTTNFGLLMKLGPEPVFFLIEGMNIVVIIGYAHLLVFLCLTLMAVLLSRLRTDQYWVIINVLIAEVLKNIFLLVGSRQKTSSSMCALMAVMIHGCSLSCFTWTMIKCIQIYRRVRYCENSSKTWQRVMCLVGGWLIPAIIVTVLALTRLPMYRQSKQCWALEDSATSIMTVYTPIAVTLAVSVFLACYTCYLFDPMKSVSVKYDGDRTTLDVQVTCMYLVLLPASWFTGIGVAFADMTYVILRYIYAGLVFVKGSVLLLGVAGNNSEVLQGIRYSNSSDEDYREAWTELRDLEGTRLEIMIEYERDRADKLRECGVTRRWSARVQPSASKTNNEDTKSEICEEHVKLESLGE